MSSTTFSNPAPTGSGLWTSRRRLPTTDGSRRLIAKFTSATDAYPVVKGEFLAMELARGVGLEVAPVELTRAVGKDVLLVERFDRPATGGRRAMISALTLTPAYDICPTPRAGGEAAQVMAIGQDGWRLSQVAGCVERASIYLVSVSDARQIIDHQIAVIEGQWMDVCEQAGLTEVERRGFWHRQFLNPYALYGY